MAEMAGEQERALRRLVSSTDTGTPDGTEIDVGALLRKRASDRVSVSVPAQPCCWTRRADRAVAAAVSTRWTTSGARRAGRPRLHPARGPRRLGHGECA